MTEDVKKLIPKNAKRVQVLDEDGNIFWRKIEELQDSDEIVKNSKGKPIVMNKPPGRGRDNPPSMDLTDQEISKARKAAVRESTLYKQGQKDPESNNFFQEIINNLTRDIAVLDFEVTEAARKGGSVSKAALNKVTALKGLADVWLRRKSQMSQTTIDLESELFKNLLAFILETFKEALEEANVRKENIQVVYAKLKSKMSVESGWFEEAKKRMED